MNLQKLTLFFCLMLATLTVSAQDEGIRFTHGLSWKAVLEKAKRENKYIFVDCFTTWCGPCKMMSRDIFPQKNVGDFFNEKFVSVKMQMDRTAKDDEEVKARYADADFLAKEYAVMAYPTFLYFTPQGKLVHLVVGTDSAKGFIAKSAAAFDPETQYYTRMENARKEVGSDPEKVKSLVREAKKVYDGVNMTKLMKTWLQVMPDVYNKEDLAFLDEMTMRSEDPGFTIFLRQPAKVDAVMGKGFSAKKTGQIIAGEELYSKWKGEGEPDMKGLESALKKKYPQQAGKLFGMFRLNVYQRNGQWNKFQAEAPRFVEKYGAEIAPAELSSLAGSIARNCSDPACLQSALKWSRQAMEAEASEPMIKSVYAHLLYRLDRKPEGIALQKEVVEAYAASTEKSGEYMLKSAKQLLEKMEKGEKTWKN
ncbi:thioredoxin family protein [Chitinophaga caseinilytica]|uniref:thioredoxin family protein n=1 Tax=Chitinophaga caseinilytica TaxID=2267521 RepID=UPI003C2D1639